MMMRCLEMGGMDVVNSLERNEQLHQKLGDANYDPNPNGFYEIKVKDEPSTFPHEYQGRVVKCLAGRRLRGLPNQLGLNYNIIFMLRDPKEINASILRMNGKLTGGYERLLKDYQLASRFYLLGMSYRLDTTVYPVDYKSVLDDPEGEFLKLAELGWPIDPYEAALGVDESLYRWRVDEL